MSKLEEFEKKLASLALELEVMKADAAQDEEWPKDGCEYWVSQTTPHAPHTPHKTFASIWDGGNTDSFRLATGNVHRTKEEAEAYRDWLTSPRTQARRRGEMCDGFAPSGPAHIYLDGSRVLDCAMSCNYSGLSFATKRQAKACIDLLGEDVIKLAFGVES